MTAFFPVGQFCEVKLAKGLHLRVAIVGLSSWTAAVSTQAYPYGVRVTFQVFDKEEARVDEDMEGLWIGRTIYSMQSEGLRDVASFLGLQLPEVTA
jgi:hypothetical protein